MTDMDMRDILPLGTGAAHGLTDWAIGRTPTYHRKAHLAPLIHRLTNVPGDAQHLVPADFRHRLMIGGRIVDVPRIHFLLDAANAVHHVRRARLDPWPSQRLVTSIG